MNLEGSGSGSISQRHGSADPDPHQNVMDPEHWFLGKLPEYRTVPVTVSVTWLLLKTSCSAGDSFQTFHGALKFSIFRMHFFALLPPRDLRLSNYCELYRERGRS